MSLLTRLFRKTAPREDEVQSVVPHADIEHIEPQKEPAGPDDEQVLKAALAAHDTASVARLVVEGSSTRVRQLAAQAVEEPDLLRRLVKDTRGGKDKNVYRILRQKCDALLAQEREARQIEEAIEARCASLERHCKQRYDELFTPTLEHFEADWKTLESQATDLTIARAQQAIARGREVIALHHEKVATQAAQADAAAQAAAQAEQERAQEREAEALAAAAEAAQRESEEEARAEHQAAQAHAIGQLSSLMRKAGAALRDGSTARAAGLRRAIDEKVQGFSALSPHLASQLQQLDSRLNELKDWKDYAAAPKRTQLIEAMKALVGTQDDPEELAVEIRRLQVEWKTISKGVAADTESDWQQFHQAAQSAYQPCREHFEALALQRQENLERRLALIARLGAFETGHDWEHADWPLVATALRDSRQKWRSHSPVDRAAGRAAQEDFDAIVQRLQERLQGEYAKNIADKQSLIARAQQALASEDSRKAIDDVKHLQQRWKAAGLVPREEGVRLWEEFRQHCDAVFQKRQQEHLQYHASLEENKAKAIALCEEVEQIGSLAGQELTEGIKELPRLREAFGTLGELPNTHARDLQKRMERALDKCESSVARERAQNDQRSWRDLFEAANEVRAYRLAVAESKDTGELDALRKAAEQYITTVPQWPKRGLQAVKAALVRPGADDIGANEAALRSLCIRAEILAGKPTPQSDQTLRREYQMKRLMEGMGRGSSADADALDKVVLEWVAVGASRPDVYQALRARLAECQASAAIAAVSRRSS
ncbi:MAG: DUF349 domain-containing protein [Steroidobacteraceae bacterium]